MRIVFFFENVVQSLNWVYWLVMNLVNFQGLKHFLWWSLNCHLFKVRVVNNLFLWLITHLLFKSHSCCELINLHDNFVSWHTLKIFLAWTYFSDFLVKIKLFNFKNFVHDLRLKNKLRFFIVFYKECESGQLRDVAMLRRWEN